MYTQLVEAFKSYLAVRLFFKNKYSFVWKKIISKNQGEKADFLGFESVKNPKKSGNSNLPTKCLHADTADKSHWLNNRA